MEFSYEDVQRILKIIDNSSLEELHLEIGEFTLIVRKKVAPDETGATTHPQGPVAVWPEGGSEPVVVPGVKEAASAKRESPSRPVRGRGVEVKAPMVGTFYLAPAPGAPPFVEVGSLVTEDDMVCIIEVMKLMNSIRAGCRGRVVEICVENGAVLEFGQTLMVIEPPSGS
jgi:acetyl-CoA carboxylase biotin carboxyl carrier protein